MATYKVLQDIEAEDKLIGPLTLRQFIYAGIAAADLYLCFILLTKGLFLALPIFLPIAAVAGFFAWPFVRQQPTEVWALAKIRFIVKPRKRIWDQNGAKELVTITVPKKVEINYTNGLSETEVQSRLRALADTIDSRGWAVKNVNVNLYSQPALIMDEPTSDRLVSASSLPQAVPTDDITASDDMLDEQNSPVAHQFDTMIAASTKAHRDEIMQRLRAATDSSDAQRQAAQMPQPAPSPAAAAPASAQPASPQNNYWFMSQPQPGQQGGSAAPGAVTFNAQVVTPGATKSAATTATPTSEEEAIVQRLDAQERQLQTPYGHLHTIQPLSAQRTAPAPIAPNTGQQATTTDQDSAQPKVTQAPDAAILNLARNDDLNVATIAREAHKQRPEPPQDEVVISLH